MLIQHFFYKSTRLVAFIAAMLSNMCFIKFVETRVHMFITTHISFYRSIEIIVKQEQFKMKLLIIVHSAYKTGHSCETDLLRVYNDNVTTIGRGNGAMLVLLDLSAAFDTIDHDNLFCILEKYVGIHGNTLKLINHIFLIVINVFKLIMFCLTLLIIFVVFLKAQF